MAKFVADIEMSLSLEELNSFKRVADLLQKPIGDVIRILALQGAKEILKETISSGTTNQ